ncbi:acetolactate synthase, putative [Medicago truncatula]|uniref:Acetolactate synthase, putative n=1 Tax=Medicago truncatula TaxID=3880 RepID=G7IQ26_MEDTR|nr:acetolactate synthase, putative [Medicago truncatula]
MVTQWEDRFYQSNKGHTYLGDPCRQDEIFPNILREAIKKMLDTLDLIFFANDSRM